MVALVVGSSQVYLGRIFMKQRVVVWLGFLFLLCVGCSESQNETSDDLSGESTTESENDQTGAEDTPVDPNVWHEDCPVDEREQRMIDVGEVRLNVACRGSGPTIVFLHGFPEFHYAWDKVMDELATEFRLIAPDQRGYNLSDKPEEVEAYTIPKLTQDIVNLLPLVSPDPVILVAHDWGGPIGWMVAHTPEAHIRGFVATNGPHPLRFSYLIENDPDQASASSYMQFFRSSAAESIVTPDYWASSFSEFLSEEDLEIYREAWSQPGAITGGLNWYRANELDFQVTQALMVDLLPKVVVPTVVMWGLDDSAVLASNAEGLDEYVEDLKVETYEGIDHWIEHHIPGEIARVVRELNTGEDSDNP